MIRKLAILFSWIFLPLFAPIYALLAVFYIPSAPKSFQLADSLFHYPTNLQNSIIALFVVFIVLAPGVSLLILKLNNSISSLSLPNKSERSAPILIMTFYCGVLVGVSYYLRLFLPNIILGMTFGGFLSSLFALMLNQKLKISLHGIGMGSLVGFLYSYYLGMEVFSIEIFYLSIVLGSIVLFSRAYLNQHSVLELFLGSALGFVCQFLSIYFYTSIFS